MASGYKYIAEKGLEGRFGNSSMASGYKYIVEKGLGDLVGVCC
jgi:hypothetical protein